MSASSMVISDERVWGSGKSSARRAGVNAVSASIQAIMPRARKSASPWPRPVFDLMNDLQLTTLTKETVEPVFGQIKAVRGFRQFLLRGLDCVKAEWQLICLTHNLLKLCRWRLAQATA